MTTETQHEILAREAARDIDEAVALLSQARRKTKGATAAQIEYVEGQCRDLSRDLTSRNPGIPTLAETHYRQRIETLRRNLNEDPEDNSGDKNTTPINPDSETDLLTFIRHHPQTARADVSLTPAGNLRLVWQNPEDRETHLGIEFLGQQQVQYVILRRPPGETGITRATGRLNTNAINTMIACYQAEQLLTGS